MDSDVSCLDIPVSNSADTSDLNEPVMMEYGMIQRHPTLFRIEPDDSHYITFFLTRIKAVLPYFEIFPNMAGDIFSRAIEDPGLLHTVLCASHYVADKRLQRPEVPAIFHQQQALASLQQSISAIDITEAVAISVAMLAWLNVCRCDRPAVNHHLDGLYLIFQEIRNPSPLLMQIWRFSIRIDILASTFLFPRVSLLPLVPVNQAHLNRSWVVSSTRAHIDTEWTLASFALDNLMHKATYVAMQAHQLRRTNPNPEPQIQQWVNDLLSEHIHWSHREVITRASQYERNTESLKSQTTQFLGYPPLNFSNKFYGNLLIHWRSIFVFVDLIASPDIGPFQRQKRWQFAIDICRSYAALGLKDMFVIGKVLSVFLTGVALGGKRCSPNEIGWMYDFLVGALQEHFPLNRDATVGFSDNFIDV
jgi:hypothetical protein